MNFAKHPAGESVFLDANVFVDDFAPIRCLDRLDFRHGDQTRVRGHDRATSRTSLDLRHTLVAHRWREVLHSQADNLRRLSTQADLGVNKGSGAMNWR